MSDIIRSIFQRRKLDVSKLMPFGFEREGDAYVYSKTLSDSGFTLAVRIADGAISAEVTDPAFGEPYTLHLSDGATGGFVGNVRAEYEETLTQIAQRCYVPEVFKSAQAHELISYVQKAYGDELEFLWAKFPDNAVWRRRDTNKWYGALLTVAARKLGLDFDGTVEIIDLRIKPDELDALLRDKHYLPGYHMNKKNWYTIVLDGSVDTREICKRIDVSYLLAAK